MSIVKDFVENKADLLQSKLAENPALAKSLIECLAAIDFYATENKVEFSQEETSSIIEKGVLEKALVEEKKAQEAERIIGNINETLEQQKEPTVEQVQTVIEEQKEVYIFQTKKENFVKNLSYVLNFKFVVDYDRFVIDDTYYFVLPHKIEFFQESKRLQNGEKWLILTQEDAQVINMGLRSVNQLELVELASKGKPVEFVLSFVADSYASIEFMIQQLEAESVNYRLFKETKLNLLLFVFAEPYWGYNEDYVEQQRLNQYYREQMVYGATVPFIQRPNIITQDKLQVLNEATQKLNALTQKVAQETLEPTFAPTEEKQQTPTHLEQTAEEDLQRIQSILSEEELQQLEALSSGEGEEIEDLEDLDDLLDI